PSVQRMFGYEYKSKRTLFGLPLVHITSGVDPTTGKRRKARGIIAIGDTARGFIAFGGIATGFFAFGGLAFGVVPVGGLALGLFATGGFAIGLIGAYGGLAIAPIAMGGLAIGYFAFGGDGWGVHMVSKRVQDPAAKEFFKNFSHAGFFYSMLVLILIPTVISIVTPLWMQRRMDKKSTGR
ncbi:MAG TPA: hypothetical protein VK615_03095, partial [Candidatus Binatia bacterium]|nr:hypothetical protein [Candidatus Binatia bacterium]